MHMTITNAFLTFHALGYGHARLIPITPPDAEVSETSSLYKRVGTPSDGRGKTPGVRNRSGLWHSFDWAPYQADDEDLDRWHAMGAGVGIKTGNGLVAIDADTTNADNARIIRDTIEQHLGRLPIRVGRYPKALYLCRTSEPYRYTRVDFGARRENGSFEERVEILSDGRQFVAHGIHPTTKQPYHWPRDIVPFHDLPTFSADQLDALMADLRQALPQAAAKLVKEGGTADVNQQALAGKLEHVTKAVKATPNTSAHFPTREAYRDFGYAIKAALPDNEPEAKELFLDWCARWQEGDNDPGTVEADWARMKPPFRRGAGWLYEIAERTNPTAFQAIDTWFDVLPEDTSPFAQIELNASKDQTDTYKLVTVDEILTRPPPPWLIARHIPRQSVGFLYSEPGAGKTFITLDAALSIATGQPDWHGDKIEGPENPAVLYIAAEGSFGFKNRIAAWLKAKNVPKNRAKSFFMIERTIDFMTADDVGRLVRTVAQASATYGVRFALVVVDTVSRAMPGADENLQKEMTLFVAACDRVRDAASCAVMGVHHAGKSGDMRGSTVLLGAGDFVFRLSRKKGASVGTLACEKQKDAPDGWEEPYRFDQVRLDDGHSSLVVARADQTIGPQTQLTPDVAARVLSAMSAAWDAGAPWSRAPQSGERRAVRRMVADFGFSAVAADEMLDLWERSGMITVETYSAKLRIRGFKVGEGLGQVVQNAGIFG